MGQKHLKTHVEQLWAFSTQREQYLIWAYLRVCCSEMAECKCKQQMEIIAIDL